ncbi:MAG: 6-carboxytetrahydropterin synthase QueD [Candidatus Zixiibacteriota bacterium]|nr:MAG: 6-carboxytetrahydropterin synthase QueD [candidate division Zixibacteria bacterium]
MSWPGTTSANDEVYDLKVSLTTRFRFEASHRLEHLPASHPCHNLHGHSYEVGVEVSGEVDEATGFLIDYSDLARIAGPVVRQLDHKHLNDVEGLDITSSEHIARWLWVRIKEKLPILSKITIYETGDCSCEYSGE